jgi:hypothetical protein
MNRDPWAHGRALRIRQAAPFRCGRSRRADLGPARADVNWLSTALSVSLRDAWKASFLGGFPVVWGKKAALCTCADRSTR